jgi:cellobiose phosphorylase
MSEAALLVFAELAELMARLGRAREAAELRRRATTLRRAINAAGWDGDRYLMGFNDDGVAVGSRRSREVRLFLLPQAWAVLAGAASRQRGRRVLELVDRKLATDYGPTLTERPFTIPDPSIGRITFLARGMSENGPAYSHGSAFKACADALTGRGDALYGGLLQFLPYRHDPAVTLAEPFAICNFYRPKAIPRKYGATHRSWVTSTPNWALKAVGWGMMGVRPGYDGIEFDPAIPRAWKRCFVRRVIRGAVYEVAIENPRGRENGVRETWLNGVKQAGRRIPYLPGPGPHRVRVVLGTPPRRRA